MKCKKFIAYIILTTYLIVYQINKTLTFKIMDVKLILKYTTVVENYYNICVALFGHLLTKYFNVKLNT